MKKRYGIVARIALVIVIGLFYMSTKNTTFKEVVFDHLNGEVSSIEIIRSSDTPNEDKITLTDPSQIELIMNAFSQTKLREVSSISNIHYTEKYWIWLKINKVRKFAITLYGKDYVNIAGEDSKYPPKKYRITNEFDPIVIRGLFK